MIAVRQMNDPGTGPGAIVDLEVRQVLADLLAELPEPYCRLLGMLELDGISMSDAACRLELREASVRLLYREGRRRLREIVLAHTEAGIL